jgi:nitroimidazol reductase NimA-like FMN-containing flavoprotein (pyridoxamine 5'-phosphate oxidase superfamily)
MSEVISPTERTQLKRGPRLGSFDRETIYQILDKAFVCHVGFTIDEQPIVIPTGYARVGDDLLIHGSAVSRMLKAMAREVDVCVSVTLIDGLVLARSVFNHSMNYRSVVIFGRAWVVSDEREKVAALHAFTERIMLWGGALAGRVPPLQSWRNRPSDYPGRSSLGTKTLGAEAIRGRSEKLLNESHLIAQGDKELPTTYLQYCLPRAVSARLCR